MVTFIDRGITGRGTGFVGDIIVLDTWFEVYEEHPVGIFGYLSLNLGESSWV